MLLVWRACRGLRHHRRDPHDAHQPTHSIAANEVAVAPKFEPQLTSTVERYLGVDLIEAAHDQFIFGGNLGCSWLQAIAVHLEHSHCLRTDNFLFVLSIMAFR